MHQLSSEKADVESDDTILNLVQEPAVALS